MKPEKPDCQIIGTGRAGRVITIAMSQAGYRFTWIGSRHREDAAKLAGQIGLSDYGIKFESFDRKAGLLILAVPDDEIGNAASDAVSAGVIGSDTIVAHLSGALGSDVLEEAQKAGASVMAFHPAQSFTGLSDPGTVFKNICFDMEGDDAACLFGERIAKDLGAEFIRLDPEARIFSHLAMTIASNYTVSLMRMSEEIMISAGIPLDTAKKMLIPLFSNTAQNISSIGTQKALTGPVSRGDTEIIKKHLDALKDLEEDYRILYRGLALIALQISVERGSVSVEKAEEIRKLIDIKRDKT